MKKAYVSTSDLSSVRGNKSQPRVCAHDGCQEDGLYPAPRTREELRDYIWFCLDHVREYNKQWNYFADMDEEAIDESIRRATTWERPSWHFGTNAKYNYFHTRINDPLGIFSEHAAAKPQHDPIPKEERDAWNELEMAPGAPWPTIKQQYKTLVKKHHPDANGGSRIAEEKLKSINQAFAILEKAYYKAE